MEKLTVYGPPGTGKTTYLLDLLDKELKTTPATRIAFVSYTKRGTYEGASRARKKFGLREHQVQYFRTIHSLCFRQLQLNKLDMVGRSHYKVLSKATGLNFTGMISSDYGHTNDDEYLRVLSMKKHNKKYSQLLLRELNEKKFNYIELMYNKMKKELELLDFDDLLLAYLKQGKPLYTKVVFIDETQDLTPLQWKVVTKMFSKAEKIVVAGDDDQAVFEWAGANVNQFLNFSANHVILNHSYRLPEKMLQVAKNISSNINVRKEKEFSSNGKTGIVDMVSSISNIPFGGGELVLSRTNWNLKHLAVKLKEEGFVYEHKGSISIKKAILDSIFNYEALQEGRIPEESFMRFRGRFKIISLKQHWTEVIKLPKEEVLYYDKVINNGRKDMEPIRLETFHSCKGGESDKVVMEIKLSNVTHKSFQHNIDAELRCLYVGATRAKERLTVLDCTHKYHYPFHYFNTGE